MKMKKVTVFLFAAVLFVCILSAIPMAYALDGHSTLDFVKNNWLTMTIVAIVITAIAGFIMLSMHNSSNKQVAAQRYFTEGGYYKIIDKQEIFERSYDTVQKNYYKQKNSNTGGSTIA